MGKSNTQINRPILEFFLLAYALSWLIWLPSLLISLGIINASQDIIDLWIYIGNLGIFGPTIAGFIMIYKHEGKDGTKKLLHSGFNIKQPKALWYLAAILPLLMLAIFIWLIFALLGSPLPVPGSQQLENVNFFSVLVIALFLFVFMFAFALGEEFGWRGYVLDPLLDRWNASKTSLILGILWALWHLPMFFITGVGQNADFNRLGPLFLVNFILITIGLTFIYTWLYSNSNSNVFIVLVFHAITNTFAALFNLWSTLESMIISVILVWVLVIILIIYYGPTIFFKEEKLK